MISLQKGYEDWKELSEIVSNVKTLNTFVDLVDGNGRYDITNDLRETKNCIDLNYKSICATIVQNKNGLTLSPDNVEVWGNDGSLNFIYLDNIIEYSRYSVKLREDGETQITRISPYDEQDYYYAVGKKICRKGKVIEVINETDSTITKLDIMILKLMKYNDKLEGICAIY